MSVRAANVAGVVANSHVVGPALPLGGIAVMDDVRSEGAVVMGQGYWGIFRSRR